jgi:hypothetical protein
MCGLYFVMLSFFLLPRILLWHFYYCPPRQIEQILYGSRVHHVFSDSPNGSTHCKKVVKLGLKLKYIHTGKCTWAVTVLFYKDFSILRVHVMYP